jgi:hypothetical protein
MEHPFSGKGIVEVGRFHQLRSMSVIDLVPTVLYRSELDIH